MTDSVTLRIDLTSLNTASRSLLAVGNIKKRRVGQHIESFRRKFVKEGPMSGAGMTLLFMQPNSNSNTLPDALVAELNLPNALVGQNYTHETCVRCAADHGLKLLKIVLAQMGVPADELEKISLDDVTFDSVTLTYIYQLAGQEEADARMAVLSSSLHAMLSGKVTEWHSTNRTVYFQLTGVNGNVYNKTDEKFISWQDGAPKDAIRKHGQRLVRLEVKLLPSFLKERDLHLPEAWRGAAEKGLYKKFFDETVGKAFRLNEPLRQKLPKPVALEKLSPTELQIANYYFEGGDPRQHPAVSDAARSIGAFSKYRLRILSMLGADIDIPWKRHQDMRHYELRQLLVCPQPYKVDNEVADWSYCKANSRTIVGRLDEALEEAIARYKANAAIRARGRRRPLLDEED